MPDDPRERIARAIEARAASIAQDSLFWDGYMLGLAEAARIARATPPEAVEDATAKPTDREALIVMLERAGLRRAIGPFPGCEEYAFDGRRIVLGQGGGWSRSEARFEFDDEGNLESYGLWE